MAREKKLCRRSRKNNGRSVGGEDGEDGEDGSDGQSREFVTNEEENGDENYIRNASSACEMKHLVKHAEPPNRN